eukprot:2186873-Rhodomonas_salina.2
MLAAVWTRYAGSGTDLAYLLRRFRHEMSSRTTVSCSAFLQPVLTYGIWYAFARPCPVLGYDLYGGTTADAFGSPSPKPARGTKSNAEKTQCARTVWTSKADFREEGEREREGCLLYTSPSPRDRG